jgi:hypothetical protein
MVPLYDLPVLVTSFAFRDEYLSEMHHMLATVRLHHPRWRSVIGRGPVGDIQEGTLEVDSGAGTELWTLPVRLNLDGGDDDWRKITRIKGWWMHEVWRQYGELFDLPCQRLLWLDADARLNGPIDFPIDPSAELFAGAWWDDPHNAEHDTVTTGFVLFQGSPAGSAAQLLSGWSQLCLQHIQYLGPKTVPWSDGDQEDLTLAYQRFLAHGGAIQAVKPDYAKYCGETTPDGQRRPGALIDQWQMSRRMKSPMHRDLEWPPPEGQRR